ncbi:YIP1 family protein [Thermoanaerobacterium sp. RBIITD]|uniref:YIP1 family protein n=1 Tax=Thermoanaerobacterium sp. RBIITD TaxID=1550240 RepID=UPI000BB7A13E|nr:YIP1 family protein [Thermoanaerobacterium sp. RBIITD]SNX55060.1 hypothetical protein SAMN05660242_2846 [Thermoanaerobacterium sp. RBIITD]
MNFFDRLYGILFQPVETLREIVRKKPFWQAVIVIIITGLLPTLTRDYSAYNHLLTNEPNFPSFGKIIPAFYSMAIAFAIIINPMTAFIKTAIYHLIAEFMDSKMFTKDTPEMSLKEIAEGDEEEHETKEVEGDIIGTGKGLYAGLSFATLPMIFLTLSNLLVRFTGWNINWLFVLIFFIWSIVLQIIAIKENYKMNGGNATLTFFLPIIVVIIVFIIMMIFIGASIASIFSSIAKDIPLKY